MYSPYLSSKLWRASSFVQLILCQLHDVVLLDCPQICIFLSEAHVSLLVLKVFYLTCHKDNKDLSNWL